jgi:hypothetical protein
LSALGWGGWGGGGGGGAPPGPEIAYISTLNKQPTQA